MGRTRFVDIILSMNMVQEPFEGGISYFPWLQTLSPHSVLAYQSGKGSMVSGDCTHRGSWASTTNKKPNRKGMYERVQGKPHAPPKRMLDSLANSLKGDMVIVCLSEIHPKGTATFISHQNVKQKIKFLTLSARLGEMWCAFLAFFLHFFCEFSISGNAHFLRIFALFLVQISPNFIHSMVLRFFF